MDLSNGERHRRKRNPLLFLATLLFASYMWGCADDGAANRCGNGTEGSGGWCIATDAGLGGDGGGESICGADRILVDGECLPAADRCGEGTILYEGRCVASAPDAGQPPNDGDAGDGGDGGEDGGGDADTCQFPQEELCDGIDNDCDGQIDEGHPCPPDEGVEHADEFEDGLFLVGSAVTESCSPDVLQQIWPSPHSEFYSGFPCGNDRYIFRPSDGRVFYHHGLDGIYYMSSDGNHTQVYTPPCGEYLGQVISFDAAGELHYTCRGTLRRGNGELVSQAVQKLAVTLDDGRSVVVKHDDEGKDVYAVVDRAGVEQSRLDLHAEFSGEFMLLPKAATSKGNRAYVLIGRTWGNERREFLAYRLNEESQWQLMRRVEAEYFAQELLLISDGTIFFVSMRDDVIVALRPHTGREVIWRDSASDTVHMSLWSALLVGPKDTPQIE